MKRVSGQISIFILVAVMIFILFFFLIFSQNKAKTENLNSVTVKTTGASKSPLFPLSDRVESCVGQELQKVLLIAGIRGGYPLYHDNYRYISGAIPPETYNAPMLEHIGLSSLDLASKTLLHVQDIPVFPKLGQDNPKNGTNSVVYTISVKDEFERYMYDSVLDCVNLTEYIDAGYNVSFPDYQGIALKQSVNGNQVRVDAIRAQVGDTIFLRSGDEQLNGEVISQISESSYMVDFKDPLKVSDFFNKQGVLTAYNVDEGVSFNVLFYPETTSVEFKFPLTVFKPDFQTSYNSGRVETQIPFSSYMSLAKKVLTEKYQNKSLDITKSEDIQKIMSKISFNSAMRSANFSFYKSSIEDSVEQKIYVISVVDYNHTIFGRPYVFNIGYYNTAPKIDDAILVKAGGQKLGGRYMFYGSTKVQAVYDLTKAFIDSHLWDTTHSYFIEDSLDSAQIKYSLTSKGILTVLLKQPTSYTLPVTITDGETSRTYQLDLISGLVNNKLNDEAKNCFRWANSQEDDSYFPVDYARNTLYEVGSKDSTKNLFGYYLSLNNLQRSIPNSIQLDRPRLYFKKSCVFNTEIFMPKVEVVSGGSGADIKYNNETEEIEGISYLSGPVKLKVRIASLDGVPLSSDVDNPPYEVTLYPVDCLGPMPYSSRLAQYQDQITKIDEQLSIIGTTNPELTAQLQQNRRQLVGNQTQDAAFAQALGGEGTCCNTQLAPTLVTPNAQSVIHNIKASGSAVSSPAYVCQDTLSSRYSDYDYSQGNIWQNENTKPNLYESMIIATCKGKFPRFEHNLDGLILPQGNDLKFSASDAKFNLKKLDLSNGPIPVQLAKVTSAPMCEACGISRTVLAVQDPNTKLGYRVGFQQQNPDAGIGFMSSSSPYLCNAQWQAQGGSMINWLPLIPAPVEHFMYVSQGFCSESGCSYSPSNPGSQIKSAGDPGVGDDYCAMFNFNPPVPNPSSNSAYASYISVSHPTPKECAPVERECRDGNVCSKYVRMCGQGNGVCSAQAQKITESCPSPNYLDPCTP